MFPLSLGLPARLIVRMTGMLTLATRLVAVHIAKPLVLSLLRTADVGCLNLIDKSEGKCYTFGQPTVQNPNPSTTVEVHSPLFYLRVLLLEDMGFAQSYLHGEVTCSDLTAFFRFFIANRTKLGTKAITTAGRRGGRLQTADAAIVNFLVVCLWSLTTRLAHAVLVRRSARNTPSGAARNIAAHYDLSNDMFAAFLSSDMTYSCPIWEKAASSKERHHRVNGTTGINTILNSASSNRAATAAIPSSPAMRQVRIPTGIPSNTFPQADTATTAFQSTIRHFNNAFPNTTTPVHPHPLGCDAEEPLTTAQNRKLHHLITSLHLQPTDHLLEIGTGWGSFAIAAARAVPGCRITTVTLSRAQAAAARERIARAGLADRVEVVCADYRDEGLIGMAKQKPAGGFDKVVSVEMVEAVGREFLREFFARVDGWVKREGGIAVVQCITMPEGRQREYTAREDFINHYIFPGGYIPSVTELLNHITTTSKGTLVVESVENIGGHYARALRLWRERFLARFDDGIRPALLKEHPDMTPEDIEVFRRKWEYYFSYCEAGFMTKTLGDVIITVAREGTMEMMEGIPL